MNIIEISREIPVWGTYDVCVLGGSATGVFAAVRAARLGASVAIVEKQNAFGGMATSGLVNIWHCLMDFQHERFIIGGLTRETMERLKKRDAVEVHEEALCAFIFNPEELKMELDEIVLEAGVKPYLCTWFAAPHLDDNGKLDAVFVENKSGRGAIKAKVFIDCTGDGDLLYRMGAECYVNDFSQPGTLGAKLTNMDVEAAGLGTIGDFDIAKTFLEHREEFGITHDGWGWSRQIPGCENVTFQAITKLIGYDCTTGDGLTAAELEGRRQLRGIMDMIRKYGPKDRIPGLVDIGSSVGIRETRHFKAMYKFTEEDCLSGVHFDDAIANGTFRVDVHHPNKAGVTFKYLDGTSVYQRSGYPKEFGRWREETAENPSYYQLPYRSLIVPGIDNVLFAGRMLDADLNGNGAARVMVNVNQLGEAAGVAAALACNDQISVHSMDTNKLRKTMSEGGSIIL